MKILKIAFISLVISLVLQWLLFLSVAIYKSVKAGQLICSSGMEGHRMVCDLVEFIEYSFMNLYIVNLFSFGMFTVIIAVALFVVFTIVDAIRQSRRLNSVSK